jgi:hypothetical protein
MAITLNNDTLTATAPSDTTIGLTSGNPAESAAQILAVAPSSTNGLYWIQPRGSGISAQQIYCDMTGGGWMLVASNDARDSTLPLGTAKNNTLYELDRTGALVGTQGISPNGDYIIGSMINSLAFDQVRIYGWGRNSTDGTFSWPSNLGTNIVATWTLNSKGTDRLIEIVPDNRVTKVGSFFVSSNSWIMDGIKGARLSGSSPNADQTTIGAAGLSSANTRDPATGTAIGHGLGENSVSCEGWYDSSSTPQNSQGYTTWVKDSTDYSNSIIIPAAYTLSGTTTAPGRIVNITRWQNSTRTALSTATSTTLWSPGNVNKLIANSKLIIMGQMPFGRTADGEVGAWWQIGSSGIRRDGIVHTGAAFGTNDVAMKYAWHIKCSYTTSSTGNLAVSLGWTTANSSSRKPGEVWNPNSTEDGRSQQHTSDLMIIEVAT